MNKKNQNLIGIGITISSLAGLLSILDLKPKGWEMGMSFLTAIIAVIGLGLILWAIKNRKAK